MAKKKQTPEKTPKKPDINAYIAGAGEQTGKTCVKDDEKLFDIKSVLCTLFC